MMTCEVYLNDLSQKLCRFQQENILCDTVLIADDHQVWAHSVILAAVSPYVYKHFLVIAGNETKCRFSLKLPGCEAVCVRAVLHFLYTGSLVLSVDFQKPETFAGILLVCEKLGINVAKLNGTPVKFVEVDPHANPCLESNGKNIELNECVIDTSFDLNSENRKLASAPRVSGKMLPCVEEKVTDMSNLTGNALEFLKAEEISPQDACDIVDIKLEVGVYDNEFVDGLTIKQNNADMPCIGANFSNSIQEFTVNSGDCGTRPRRKSAFETVVTKVPFALRNASVKMASKILKNTLQKSKKLASTSFRRAQVSDMSHLDHLSQKEGFIGDQIRKRLKRYEKGAACPMCNKVFKWRSDLKKHMETFQEHSALTCKDCGKVLSCRRQLRAHERLHLGRRLHICTICGKVYRFRSGLLMHSYEHTGQLPYLCDLCGSGFKNFFAMSQHKKLRHSTYRPFVCKECGKGFIRNALLLRHMMVHSGEKLNICPKCGMSFSFSGNLSRHLRTHDGVKPHGCTVCGRRFNRIDHLQTHLTTHNRKTMRNEFICAECNKVFKSLWLLKRHELIHSDENTYSCGVCTKRFTGATRLKQHMVAHEEKQFVCHVCERTFTYERFLMAHIKKIHEDNVAPSAITAGSL